MTQQDFDNYNKQINALITDIRILCKEYNLAPFRVWEHLITIQPSTEVNTILDCVYIKIPKRLDGDELKLTVSYTVDSYGFNFKDNSKYLYNALNGDRLEALKVNIFDKIAKIRAIKG